MIRLIHSAFSQFSKFIEKLLSWIKVPFKLQIKMMGILNFVLLNSDCFSSYLLFIPLSFEFFKLTCSHQSENRNELVRTDRPKTDLLSCEDGIFVTETLNLQRSSFHSDTDKPRITILNYLLFFIILKHHIWPEQSPSGNRNTHTRYRVGS